MVTMRRTVTVFSEGCSSTTVQCYVAMLVLIVSVEPTRSLRQTVTGRQS